MFLHSFKSETSLFRSTLVVMTFSVWCNAWVVVLIRYVLIDPAKLIGMANQNTPRRIPKSLKLLPNAAPSFETPNVELLTFLPDSATHNH